MRIAAFAVLLMLVAKPALAADVDTATGTFTSQTVTLNAKSAIAFRGKSFVDPGDALIVAVFNARVNAAAIADFADRRRVIETRIRDGETGVVYFEFKPDGTYRGMSYSFGPGNGCGYCAGDVKSTVKLASGKLSGKLAGSEKDRTLDITLVTPVMADDHGGMLPPDGGAPGKAYLAYHAALAKGDRATLKPLLSQGQQQFWDEAEKNRKVAAFLHAMAEAHPVKSVQITQGFVKGDKALLQVAGEASAGRVVGEVLLVKEGEAWRVDDEITEAAPR
jgi:hypothetical protein